MPYYNYNISSGTTQGVFDAGTVRFSATSEYAHSDFLQDYRSFFQAADALTTKETIPEIDTSALDEFLSTLPVRPG